MNNFGWNYDTRQYHISYGNYSRGLWRGTPQGQSYPAQQFHQQQQHHQHHAHIPQTIPHHHSHTHPQQGERSAAPSFPSYTTLNSKQTALRHHHHQTQQQLNETQQRQRSQNVVVSASLSSSSSSSSSTSPSCSSTTTTSFKSNSAIEEETAEKLISSSSSSSVEENRPSVSSDVLDEMEYILSGISTNLTTGSGGGGALFLTTTHSPQTHSNYQLSPGTCYIAPTSYTTTTHNMMATTASWRGNSQPQQSHQEQQQQPQQTSQINFYSSNQLRSSNMYPPGGGGGSSKGGGGSSSCNTSSGNLSSAGGGNVLIISHQHNNNLQQSTTPDIARTSRPKPKDDLSEIVNQVLNTVDAQPPPISNQLQQNQHPPVNNNPSPPQVTQHRVIKPKPAGICSSLASGNLCHNCGSIVSNILTHCQLCGESIQIEESKRTKVPKPTPSSTRTLRPRNVGVVEPRIVVKTPHSRKDSPRRKSPSGRRKGLLETLEGEKTISPLGLIRRVKRKLGSDSDYESETLPSETRIAFQPNKTKKFLICSIDGCTFTTNKPERMGRHVASHSTLNKDCSDNNNNNNSGSKNSEAKHNKKPFQCPDCGAKFSSMAKMLRHDRKVHTGITKDYECRLCEAEVTDVDGHSKVHKEDKNIQCKDCNLIFRHRSSYIRHLSQHSSRDAAPSSQKTSEDISAPNEVQCLNNGEKKIDISIILDKPEMPFTINIPEIREPLSQKSNSTESSSAKSPEEVSKSSSPPLSKVDYSSPLPSSSDSGISSNFNSPIYSESNAFPPPSSIESFENTDLPNILAQSLFDSANQEDNSKMPFEFNVDLFNDSLCPQTEELSKALAESLRHEEDSVLEDQVSSTKEEEIHPPNKVLEEKETLVDSSQVESQEQEPPSPKTLSDDHNSEIEIAKIQRVFEKELEEIANDSKSIKPIPTEEKEEEDDSSKSKVAEELSKDNSSSLTPSVKHSNQRDQIVQTDDIFEPIIKFIPDATIKSNEKPHEVHANYHDDEKLKETADESMRSDELEVEKQEHSEKTKESSSSSVMEDKDIVVVESVSVLPKVPAVSLKRKIFNDEYLKKVANMLHEIEVSSRVQSSSRAASDSRKWKRRKVSLKDIEDNFKGKVQQFIEQLKCIREDRTTKKEENFSCNKCGRVYKFENFFNVHKRRCA